MKAFLLGIFYIACLGFVASTSLAGVTINGAGASFPYPLYSKWVSEYSKVEKDVTINYNSIGSGGGIRQLSAGTVDFGASDTPMTDSQIKEYGDKKGVPVVHLPMVLGAVVISYNLPKVSGTLNLSGEAISAIFMGKIKTWNDPLLKGLNPQLALPNLPLIVISRSDGSGTTGVFTDYLAKVSGEFKTQVGQGPTVKWPKGGLSGKGNEGVTALIRSTPGAIGYIEMIYAMSNQLAMAAVRNQKGSFITPSMEAVSAAAKAVIKTIPEDFRISITDSPAKEAYPISSFTYVLVPSRLPAERGVILKRFLAWAVTKGQDFAPALHYAKMPIEIAKKAEKRITQLEAK